MLEKDIEKRFVAGVTALGGKAYKFVSPAHRGVSDRLVVLPGGRVWFVELKTEVGKLTALQEHFRREVQALGANYICLYGAQDVDNWLLYVEVAK